MGEAHATGRALPDSADIVVIGAGLVGLATAFYAASARLERIIVLERGRDLADLTSANVDLIQRSQWRREPVLRLCRAPRERPGSNGAVNPPPARACCRPRC